MEFVGDVTRQSHLRNLRPTPTVLSASSGNSVSHPHPPPLLCNCLERLRRRPPRSKCRLGSKRFTSVPEHRFVCSGIRCIFNEKKKQNLKPSITYAPSASFFGKQKTKNYKKKLHKHFLLRHVWVSQSKASGSKVIFLSV